MNPSAPFISARIAGPRCLLFATAVVAALAAAPAARADDAPASAPSELASDEAFYQRAATCAAAMQVDQLALVAKVRAGVAGARPDLVQLTKLGFTYVGTAYKRGLRNPRADQMLKDATAEQKSWSAARHAQTVSECRKEGEALFDGASSMEQWLVGNRASARVDRYLKSTASANPASVASSAITAH